MNIFELAMLKKNKGGGSGGGSSAPADWNASEGEAGYIKNRTHWAEVEMIEVLPETTMVLPALGPALSGDLRPIPVAAIPAVGSTLKVVYDGVEYSVVTVDADEMGVAFGNLAATEAPLEPSFDVPFLGTAMGVGGVYAFAMCDINGEGEHTFSISCEVETVHKLDPKYLPERLIITHVCDDDSEVITANMTYYEARALFDEGMLNSVVGRMTRYGTEYFSTSARIVFDDSGLQISMYHISGDENYYWESTGGNTLMMQRAN